MAGNAFAQSVETIKILVPWSENQNTVKVTIINKAGLSDDKISVIKNAIESDVSFVENDQIYFAGWTGALHTLDSAKAKRFDVTVSEKARGADIIIELLKEKDPRYNGYTIPYYVGNHIISASIQIFESQTISSVQLENLMRHEFGHALGLGHTTEPGCIMYETISSNLKFIGSCELAGLKALEDGLYFRSVDSSLA